MREPITMTTGDNVRIAGDWYPVVKPSGWAILLHMMPATKESYVVLATKLQERGIASLAIDFRGHGASEGGPKGYEQFTDAQQQTMIKDVDAAYLWLEAYVADQVSLPAEFFEHPPGNYLQPRLAVVGASIGANLALEFLANYPMTAKAVLLSPGLNYRGVDADVAARRIVAEMAKGIGAQRKVLLAAGGANDEYSTRSIQQLAAILGPAAETAYMFGSTGHGTAMFDGAPEFLEGVVEWIGGIAKIAQ